MKNLALAVAVLFSATGVLHSLDAHAAGAVRVNPGISASAALDDQGSLSAEKKKKKKKKGGEESEEEFLAR